MVKPGIERRLTDSIENVLNLSEGLLFVERVGSDEEMLTFSQSFSCPDCGVSIDEIGPRSFSFNNPFGACPECYGLGYKMEFDSDLMIPGRTLSINQGAITVLGWQSCRSSRDLLPNAILQALAKNITSIWIHRLGNIHREIQDILLHGTGGKEVLVYYEGQRGKGQYPIAFEGLIRNVERRYRETGSDAIKQEYETFMRITPCRLCKGTASEKRSAGSNRVREKYIRNYVNVYRRAVAGFCRI